MHSISVLAARCKAYWKHNTDTSHIEQKWEIPGHSSTSVAELCVQVPHTGLANSGRHSHSYGTQGELQHQLILSAVHTLSKAKPLGAEIKLSFFCNSCDQFQPTALSCFWASWAHHPGPSLILFPWYGFADQSHLCLSHQ